MVYFRTCSFCGRVGDEDTFIIASRFKVPLDFNSKQEIYFCRDKPGERSMAYTWMRDRSYEKPGG